MHGALLVLVVFCFFKQKTAYEMRISDWSSDVCSSDLHRRLLFDHWGVTDAQAAVLLGDIAVRTYQRWKQGEYGRWNVDLAARLSNQVGRASCRERECTYV